MYLIKEICPKEVKNIQKRLKNVKFLKENFKIRSETQLFLIHLPSTFFSIMGTKVPFRKLFRTRELQDKRRTGVNDAVR